MRVIKFRGKDIETGEWLYGDLRQRAGCFPSIIQRTCCEGKIAYNEIAVKRETVGQFTGMLDKNGKEIYFDDIVSDKYGDIGSVVWCSDWTMRVDWGGGEIHFIDPNWGLEVIGNIHDNPELLKGGNHD